MVSRIFKMLQQAVSNLAGTVSQISKILQEGVPNIKNITVGVPKNQKMLKYGVPNIEKFATGFYKCFEYSFLKKSNLKTTYGKRKNI